MCFILAGLDDYQPEIDEVAPSLYIPANKT